MEEPGRLQSMLRVGHDWVTSLSIFTFMHWRRTHSSVLVWRIPGMGEPGGLPSMGSHRVGHDWSDLAAAAAAKHEEKTAYKAIRRCCGGFRKAKVKDFNVKSQELLKQHWLFSRRDAHNMQRHHGSCTEREGLSSGKAQMFWCSSTCGLFMLLHLHPLIWTPRAEAVQCHLITITRSPKPDFGCSHLKSIYLWQIYLVQRGMFLAGKTNSWR